LAYLFSRLQRRRLTAVVFAALKGLNMTAQGNALGTENGHESKPCKGEIGEVGGAAIGRDLFHALYAALSGLGLPSAPATQGVALG